MFRYDSPFMNFCSKISDLVFLNVLAVICSIPIFTIGAASTALYDAIYRLKMDEGHIYSAFFQAFASNFKKATLLWLMFLPVTALLTVAVFLCLFGSLNNTILLSISFLLLMVWLMGLSWVFPLQARFENSVMQTFRNSFSFAMAFAPRSILMALLNGIPLICVAFPNLLSILGMPLVCFYFSIVVFLNLNLMKKPFSRFAEEPQDTEEES